MLLKELLEVVESDIAETEITGVTCNSKAVKPGFAFVCIEGTVADGHLFAENALIAGAAAIITQKYRHSCSCSPLGSRQRRGLHAGHQPPSTP